MKGTVTTVPFFVYNITAKTKIMQFKNALYIFPLTLCFVNCSTSKEVVVTKPVEPVAKFTSFKDSVSYAMGASTAKQFKGMFGDSQDSIFDLKKYETGLREGLNDSLALSENEIRDIMGRFQTELSSLKEKQREAAEIKNKKEGADFLAANKTKEGVITTESGLQYKVLNHGTGATPSDSDRVEVHYEGRLLDGTVFDSSYKRGEPITLGVGQVIKGWTEALKLMKAGSKYQLYIPADLAYGERGAGADIPPYATLIFDVELLSVK